MGQKLEACAQRLHPHHLKANCGYTEIEQSQAVEDQVP